MAAPTTYLYNAEARHALTDPKAYAAGVRHDVDVAYAYSSGQRYVVYLRTPLLLTTNGTVYWDTVPLKWTAPSCPVEKYVLKRNGTKIYEGAALSYTDTWPAAALRPSTTYTYVVEAWLDGRVASSATRSVVTAAHADLGLTATAPSYNYIQLRWTDPDKRSIDWYNLYRDNYGLIDSGSDKAHDDGGLAENTRYYYTLRAYRAGVEISRADNANARTTMRPTTTATASMTGRSGWQWRMSSGPWTVQSTFGVNAGSNNIPHSEVWVTRMSMQVRGYCGCDRESSAAATDTYIDPGIYNSGGGSIKNLGMQYVGRAYTSDTGSSPSFAMGDLRLGTGTYRIGFTRASGYGTQWDNWNVAGYTMYYDGGVASSGQSLLWSITYWYYSALGEKIEKTAYAPGLLTNQE